MSYNITVIALVAIILLFVVFEQVLMIKIINAKGESKEIEIPKPKMPRKKPKMSEQDKRTMQILQNIDNYNGTGFNQIEVKKVGEK